MTIFLFCKLGPSTRGARLLLVFFVYAIANVYHVAIFEFLVACLFVCAQVNVFALVLTFFAALTFSGLDGVFF